MSEQVKTPAGWWYGPAMILKTLLLFSAMFSLGAVAEDKLPLEKIHLPPGFRIELFARVKGARSLTYSPSGILYVGTRDTGEVYAVKPDGKTFKLASGLNSPNGVAFRDGDLYIGEINRISKLPQIESHLDHPPALVVLNDKLPKDAHHGWKFMKFGPDGWLYVPIGAPCNICEPGDPYASITRMHADGTGMEIYARGIRNTVGFDWQPGTNVLWFTDNGRDYLGDDSPPDRLVRDPKEGLNFGYPYCHAGEISDPEFGKKHPCSDFAPTAQKLGPHVASLGMRFYTGKMFPAEYTHQIFIAEHGSWNRSVPIGYRVTLVKVNGDKTTSYTPFAEGFLQGKESWGRPVDVQVAPDGALMVSDDLNGAIYRISYSK
jgi:glucose/arabinose dehydrogenase